MKGRERDRARDRRRPHREREQTEQDRLPHDDDGRARRARDLAQHGEPPRRRLAHRPERARDGEVRARRREALEARGERRERDGIEPARACVVRRLRRARAREHLAAHEHRVPRRAPGREAIGPYARGVDEKREAERVERR